MLLSVWLLPVDASPAELIEIRSATHRDFTRVVLETDTPVPYSIENRSRGSQASIEVYFPAAATAARVGASRLPVTGIRLEEIDASRSLARLVVAEPVDVWTNRLSKPPRIVLDLRPAPPAEQTQARDPEDLSDLDYQIVVEPGERNGGGFRARPSLPGMAGTAQQPERHIEPEPSQEPSVAAPPPPSRIPPTAPAAGEMGWRRWARLLYDHAPWSWIALAWIAVAILFLLFARLSRSREADEWGGPLEAPQPPARPGPVAKPSAAASLVPPPAPNAPAEMPPVAEPKIARPRPPAPVRSPAEATGEVEHVAAPGASIADFLIMLRKLDRRIERLEQDLAKTREAQASLEVRSAAQAEELRMQRVTVARFGRRPERPRVPNAPPASSS